MGSPVAGAVLTGGASTRMGRDKATLAVGGVAMARRVADALAAGGCGRILAVGGDCDALARLGMDVVPDEWPGAGPLGAVIVAIGHAATDVVVAACDLPWLDAATVANLVDTAVRYPDADVVHAVTPRVEPLCALWRPRSLPILHERFTAGERAVHAVIGHLVAVACPVDPERLRNVNRPGDLPNR